MSGTNLPVRIAVEGAPQAETAINAVAAVGERAAARMAGAFQGAANAIGGELGTALSTAGSYVERLGGLMDGLATSSSRAEGVVSLLNSRLAAIAGLAGLPFLLQSMGLGINAAGEAASGAAETTDRWRASLLQLDPVLQAVARDANSAAAAMLRARQAQYETELGPVLERRGTLIGQQADLNGQIARLQRRISEVEAQSVAGSLAAPADTGPAASEYTSRAARALAERRQRLGAQAQQSSQQDTAALLASLRAQETELLNRRTAVQEEIALRGGQVTEGELARLRNFGVPISTDEAGPPAPDRPGRTGGGGGSSAQRGAGGVDVQAALARMTAESTEAFNRFNDQINLANAGLERGADELRRYESDMQMLETALSRGVISEEQFQSAVADGTQRLGEQLQNLDRASKSASRSGHDFGRAFESAFEKAAAGGERLSTIMKALEQDIARAILRAAVGDPLNSAIGSAVDAAKPVISGFFSGLFAPSGARASGGPVFAGQEYWVGENGPERVRFGAAGTVIPNTGGGFTQHVTIDARGAGPGVGAQIQAAMAMAKEQAKQEFLAMVSRGGSVARAVGRRA